MARDYNSRRTASRKQSGPQQFLVLMLTFVLGYLTASVVDLPTLSQWVNTQVLAGDHEKPKSAQKVQKAQKTQETPPKPKFEFYTLLEKDKVPHSNPARPGTTQAAAKPVAANQTVADSATHSAKTLAPKVMKPGDVKVAEGKALTPVNSKQSLYVLQVAAFKARSDAEHMKANLTLKGYNVSVSPVTNARGNWFRVIIGPYADKSSALQAQAQVARNERLRGMVNPIAG